MLAVGASEASSASTDKPSAMTSPSGENSAGVSNGVKDISHGLFENIVSFGGIVFMKRGGDSPKLSLPDLS